MITVNATKRKAAMLALAAVALLAACAPVQEGAGETVRSLQHPQRQRYCPDPASIPDIPNVRWCCVDATGKAWLMGTPAPEPLPRNLAYLCRLD